LAKKIQFFSDDTLSVSLLEKRGIFQMVSATRCLLIVHHTEKLNRLQRDDRPHNSIPLDEMIGGRPNRQRTHPHIK
jgi:hypothetical protein